jgi:hypothetical protein
MRREIVGRFGNSLQNPYENGGSVLVKEIDDVGVVSYQLEHAEPCWHGYSMATVHRFRLNEGPLPEKILSKDLVPLAAEVSSTVDVLRAAATPEAPIEKRAWFVDWVAWYYLGLWDELDPSPRAFNEEDLNKYWQIKE